MTTATAARPLSPSSSGILVPGAVNGVWDNGGPLTFSKSFRPAARHEKSAQATLITAPRPFRGSPTDETGGQFVGQISWPVNWSTHFTFHNALGLFSNAGQASPNVWKRHPKRTQTSHNEQDDNICGNGYPIMSIVRSANPKIIGRMIETKLSATRAYRSRITEHGAIPRPQVWKHQTSSSASNPLRAA